MEENTTTDVTKAARKAQAAYKREWNRRNPDKNREYIKRYWAKKAKELEAKNDAEYKQ